MPASYTLHPDLGLLATRFIGVVDDDEFLELYRAIFADPAYVLGTNELADLTEAVELRFSARGMRRVEHLTRRVYHNEPEAFRTAVLAPSDLAFGIGRMYGALADGGPERVSVFRDADAAFTWLELEPIPDWKLHAPRRT